MPLKIEDVEIALAAAGYGQEEACGIIRNIWHFAAARERDEELSLADLMDEQTRLASREYRLRGFR